MARRIVRAPDPIDPDNGEDITLDWTKSLKGRNIVGQVVRYERNCEAYIDHLTGQTATASFTSKKTQFPVTPTIERGRLWVENGVMLDTGETITAQFTARVREQG